MFRLHILALKTSMMGPVSTPVGPYSLRWAKEVERRVKTKAVWGKPNFVGGIANGHGLECQPEKKADRTGCSRSDCSMKFLHPRCTEIEARVQAEAVSSDIAQSCMCHHRTETERLDSARSARYPELTTASSLLVKTRWRSFHKL